MEERSARPKVWGYLALVPVLAIMVAVATNDILEGLQSKPAPDSLFLTITAEAVDAIPFYYAALIVAYASYRIIRHFSSER